MIAKVSLVLNVLLIAGFVYLFVQVNDQNAPSKKEAQADNQDKEEKESHKEGGMDIAYVNVDSLFANYEFIKDLNAELKEDLMRSEQKVQRSIKALENKYVEHQEQSAYYTQREIAEAQQELQQMEMNIKEMQEKLQNDYIQKEQKLQNRMMDAIQKWLDDYNKLKKYDYILTYTRGGQILYGDKKHEITSEVIKGLNEAYKSVEETEAEINS